MKKKEKMKTLYCYIMNKCSYLGVGKPDLSKEWVYSSAADMISKGKGNCYCYSSIIGLLAKALGYKTSIVTGKCKRSAASGATEHSWVVVSGKYILDGVYEDVDYKGSGNIKFFFQTYDQIKDSVGYIYYPD